MHIIFWGVRGGDGEVGVREDGQGGVPVPGVIAADLVVVQAGLVLRGLEALLDGLITNGKFCCVRQVRLSLSWWHRPLCLRDLSCRVMSPWQESPMNRTWTISRQPVPRRDGERRWVRPISC
jgi:hypothetical protein